MADDIAEARGGLPLHEMNEQTGDFGRWWSWCSSLITSQWLLGQPSFNDGEACSLYTILIKNLALRSFELEIKPRKSGKLLPTVHSNVHTLGEIARFGV